MKHQRLVAMAPHILEQEGEVIEKVGEGFHKELEVVVKVKVEGKLEEVENHKQEGEGVIGEQAGAGAGVMVVVVVVISKQLVVVEVGIALHMGAGKEVGAVLHKEVGEVLHKEAGTVEVGNGLEVVGNEQGVVGVVIDRDR